MPPPKPIAKVLVTGAAGYLAGSIIAQLERTYALTLFDRVAPDSSHPFIEGDITDPEAVTRACRGQDGVVHTVALVRGRQGQPATAFADTVVKGTWHVLEACIAQGVRRLVNISSIVADGAPVPSPRPHLPGNGTNFTPSDLFYCLSKQLGENLGAAYAQAHGLEVFHLRPGVIAGDGANPDPQPPPKGAGLWFVYVDPRDVAQAVGAALATRRRRGTYCIVAGRRDSLFDWRPAARELGYAPQHNWPDIEESAGPRDSP